ncbi:MAG: hypothetical protein JFR41_10955 [Muribaculaceae bacterium]|nr:hypothetical protein [Muribaculaceae bacterium]
MTPIAPTAERLIIRWNTRDPEAIAAIRKRFGIPAYTTVNGWSPVEIEPEDMPVFDECARRNFFGIIRRKWSKNGGRYIF